MSCCCFSTYKFCQAVHTCDADSFLAILPSGVEDGNYIVRLDFLGADLEIPVTVTDGEWALQSDFTLNLNEHFAYTAKIYNSDGNEITLYYNTVAYDCIQFNTKLLSS